MSWSVDAPLVKLSLENFQRTTLSRYAFGVAAVGAVSIVAIIIHEALGTHSHSETLLILGVVLATWFGGLGPGIFTTALAAIVANLFLIGPAFIEEGEIVNLGVLVIVCLITASLYDALRGARSSEEQMREEVNAAEELVGFVSHELRNPAAIIGGNLRLLSKQPEVRANEALLTTVTLLEEEAAELAGIIDHLLVLSTNGEHSAVCKEPVLLPRLLSAQIESHGARYPQRPITLSCGDDCALIEANEEHMRLIIRNFFENAEKYSPNPLAPLEVVATRGSCREVAISVLDRGIGITPDEADSVFESFYRSDSVKTTKAGFGLGLAVCKRLAEAGGGRIWAKPRPDGGSEFGFTVEVLRLHGDEDI